MAPHPFKLGELTARSYKYLCSPLRRALTTVPKLTSRGNRPLQMDFEDQLHALIYFHLQEHTSGRHLLQSLEEDNNQGDQVWELDTTYIPMARGFVYLTSVVVN